MKLLVDMLDSIDCLEMDLHTDKSDPEATDFGYMSFETFKRLDIMLGETVFFKQVEFVLDEIEHYRQICRSNKGKLNEYFIYKFVVSAEEKKREEDRILRQKVSLLNSRAPQHEA